MRLVEQHIIRRSDRRFQQIDEMALASKNLWNLANYYVRQSFIQEHAEQFTGRPRRALVQTQDSGTQPAHL